MIRAFGIVKNEAQVLTRMIAAAALVCDDMTLIDTGSTDDSALIAATINRDTFPVTFRHSPWVDFGHNLTEALTLGSVRGGADWLLRLDADMTVDVHPDFVEWLAGDPDPTVDAWQVQIVDGTLRYWLPLLLRAGKPWRYVGETHEYLDCGEPFISRQVLGLTVHHLADGGSRAGKHERDLALLAEGIGLGDARATFYGAQALECLGRTDEAADAYEARAIMVGTWEEERWVAAYRCAVLREDVPGLLEVAAERPWRHEPLTAAARLVDSLGSRDDVLFLEQFAG